MSLDAVKNLFAQMWFHSFMNQQKTLKYENIVIIIKNWFLTCGLKS